MKKLPLIFVSLFLIYSSFSSQNRVVLIEQFSNSSCPPCGAVSPSVYAFANANQSDVAVIAYHTLFPYNNDSMYFENPVEATQRVNYYGVSGVPYSLLDGSIYTGSTNSFISGISTHVSNRLSVSPRYEIEATSLDLNNNQLSGSLKFTSTNTSNNAENLIAHIVIIEKNVLKSSYAASPGANNETEYGYVMRKMIPGANGTNLANTGLSGVDDITFNWTLSHIKNQSEIRVVAFVQNLSTKEIYQAQLFAISEIHTGFNKNNNPENKLDLFPNPTNGDVTLSFNKEQEINSLKITDIAGAMVYSKEIMQSKKEVKVELDLPVGIYYFMISTSSGDLKRKFVVVK